MNESIDALILKLSILDKGIEDSKIDLLVHFYKKSSQKYINEGRKLVETFNDKKYHSEYANVAYNILSCSPFSSRVHLCQAFKCNKKTFNIWYQTELTLQEKVDSGFINGEVLARDLIRDLSLMPASKVNTSLIKILMNNVYSIEEPVAHSDMKVNITSKKSPEEELKERGIPVPKIDIEDLNE